MPVFERWFPFARYAITLYCGREKKVTFQFDAVDYEHLEQVREKRGYDSVGEIVGRSLKLQDTLWSEEEKGFNEILVHNPQKDKTRILRF